MVTVSNNVKRLRSDRGISQKELADSAKVSFRAIQEIESGKANPTVGTLKAIATAFKVTVEYLMALSHVRLRLGDESFLERFSRDFKSANIGIAIRTLEGVCLWGNLAAQKIHGGFKVGEGPFNFLDGSTLEARGVLKNQMTAEKSGFCNPYTLAHLHPKTKETLFFKCYPTLIMPAKGDVPMLTALYFSEMRTDCALNYFEYCHTLLNVVANGDPTTNC